MNFVGEKIVTSSSMLALEEIRSVDEAALFVRRERQLRGWTAQQLVDAIVRAAADAGDELSLTQQAVSFFETGKAKSIPRWLRYAEAAFAAPARNLQTTAEAASSKIEPEDDVEIDAIDLAYGMGGAFLDNHDPDVERAKFSRTWLRQFTSASPELLFSAQGIGDSMWPTIHDRDVVIGDRSSTRLDQADKIWAVVYGGVGMIKRLRPLPDGTVRIMSDNPQVSDELATDGDLHIVGRVAAIVRRV